MSEQFTEIMVYEKSTKNTHVYVSEVLRAIYIPKDVISQTFGAAAVPDKISITITKA